MSKTLTIGHSTFEWGRQTYLMGIINATPDSFSGDGLMRGEDWVARAVEQGRRFAAEGAHLLDVGGESTRPGAAPVGIAEEIRRVRPVIAALAAEVRLPISIDTWKAEVAAAALEACGGTRNWPRCAPKKMPRSL
jgi:dihydropteroate synthase